MPAPNILILHTDQQRFDTINALGWEHVDTPNMDRLVKRGTAFTRAYSANPVCMAARHDLLTGVSARHHGYWSNSSSTMQNRALRTVPQMFTESGYQTVAVGKMHHNPEREHHGWAHMRNMEELPSCRENDAYLQYLERVGYGHIRCQHGVRPLFYHVPQRANIPEEHHGSAWVAHEAIDWIGRDRDRPFFIFASWVGPHPPFYVPQTYLDRYRDRPLPELLPAADFCARQMPSTPEMVSGVQLQRVREAYFAATTLIDTHIGRILDALEESGQMDDTVIVLTSDHGEMLGDQGGFQKQVPHEGAAHIPIIACGPGLAQGICDTPVTTWDVAATALEAAGVNVPQEHPLVGQSLRTVAAEGGERTIVCHHGQGAGRYVSGIGGSCKFTHWYNGGEEWLFDLADDPGEQVNLIDRAPEVAEPLRRACLDFEAEYGVGGGGFADRPYSEPRAHKCSLHPTWSYGQYPRWTTGYSEEDLDLIAGEMRACLEEESVFIHADPGWRAEALRVWTGLGGRAQVIEELFQAADTRAGG
ncbi:MAG: sulfatase-like hydrolase/transferase [Candidatus Latescibacteria bacterium]|nr:sulfatase-like hydrolase/transferase [Candidatus Latescibacterota bacterium]